MLKIMVLLENLAPKDVRSKMKLLQHFCIIFKVCINLFNNNVCYKKKNSTILRNYPSIQHCFWKGSMLRKKKILPLSYSEILLQNNVLCFFFKQFICPVGNPIIKHYRFDFMKNIFTLT